MYLRQPWRLHRNLQTTKNLLKLTRVNPMAWHGRVSLSLIASDLSPGARYTALMIQSLPKSGPGVHPEMYHCPQH